MTTSGTGLDNAALVTLANTFSAVQYFTMAPTATANYGNVNVGDGGFAGGVGHYAGAAGGSLIAVNALTGAVYDLINLQVAGVSKFKVGAGGNATLGEGSNLILGTTTGTKFGTSASQKMGWYNAAPVAQISGTTDLLAGLVTQGFRAASGAVPCNLNGGDLTANQGNFSGALKGSGTALTFGRLAFTFPSDADHTLDTTERVNMILDIQAGVISGPKNIIVPGSAGSTYHVINRQTTHAVTIKTAASAGIAVAPLRSRIIDFPGGTTGFAMTVDTDYSV